MVGVEERVLIAGEKVVGNGEGGSRRGERLLPPGEEVEYGSGVM